MQKMVVSLALLAGTQAFGSDIQITVTTPETVRSIMELGKETGKKFTGSSGGRMIEYSQVQVNSYTTCYKAEKITDTNFFHDWSWDLKDADFCLVTVTKNGNP